MGRPILASNPLEKKKKLGCHLPCQPEVYSFTAVVPAEHLVPINHMCHASDKTIYSSHSLLCFQRAKFFSNQAFPRLLLTVWFIYT